MARSKNQRSKKGSTPRRVSQRIRKQTKKGEEYFREMAGEYEYGEEETESTLTTSTQPPPDIITVDTPMRQTHFTSRQRGSENGDGIDGGNFMVGRNEIEETDPHIKMLSDLYDCYHFIMDSSHDNINNDNINNDNINNDNINNDNINNDNINNNNINNDNEENEDKIKIRMLEEKMEAKERECMEMRDHKEQELMKWKEECEALEEQKEKIREWWRGQTMEKVERINKLEEEYKRDMEMARQEKVQDSEETQ